MNRTSISRREFLAQLVKSGAGATVFNLTLPHLVHWLGGSNEALAAEFLDEILRLAPTARFWTSANGDNVDCGACHTNHGVDFGRQHTHDQNYVQCQLCAQNCHIEEGQRGRCRARLNVGGELKSLVYGRPVSIHIDPIEKKPFYHFLPGSLAFSMATTGCPLACQFCQNWEISQAQPEDFEPQYVPPEQIVRVSTQKQAPVIAFTYNEPTVFCEYLLDIAELARAAGLRSVLISCGFMNEAPLTAMCDVLDAIKIDLKGFSEDFYRQVTHSELQPVLRSIKHVAARDTHLEIVNLVVPTLNDSEPMMHDLVNWVFNEVGPDVPIHFTRFHPDYKLLNLPPTPIHTLELARELAREKGIHYPFVGNVPGHPGNHTYCPNCGEIVIKRSGFFIDEIHLPDGACEFCQTKIAGVWS